jgi:hypothetical protein
MDSGTIRDAVERLKKSDIRLDYLVACGAYGCDMGKTIPSV